MFSENNGHIVETAADAANTIVRILDGTYSAGARVTPDAPVNSGGTLRDAFVGLRQKIDAFLVEDTVSGAEVGAARVE
jgi:hypothetical protein